MARLVIPGRFRLLPAAVLAWAAAGISIGVPHAAGFAAAIVAVTAVLVAAFASGRPTAVLVAVALGAAAVVLGSVAVLFPARTAPDLVAAAVEGRAVDLDIVVGARVGDTRFSGTIAGTRVPVLVVVGRERDDGTPPPPIGATVGVRADLEATDPGDDVAFLVFPLGDLEPRAGPPPLLAAAHGIRAGFGELSSGLPEPGGDLLPGLAIGDTSRVGDELDAAMIESSLSHLTAVSGANCAIVVAAVLALVARAGASLPIRVAAAGAALVGFVVLVTPEPSVLRAATMAALALGAAALGRPALGMPLLCVAVIGLLVLDPWLARSYGFALSALATAGLLALAGPLVQVLARRMPDWLATVISVPLSAQLACQPLLVLLDPTLPLLGVPANLLAAPAAPVATVVGLLACVVGAVVPQLGVALAWVGWLPASWIAATATMFAGMPGARGPWLGGVVGVLSVLALEGALLLALLGKGRMQRLARGASLIILVAYSATAIGGFLLTRASRPVDWQYAMCDVGQGDATLVRRGDAVALIDVGPEPERLRSCLDDLGVERLDLVVLTHFDLDHVGGADAVVGRADTVLTGPVGEVSDTRLLAAFAQAGAEVVTVERGDRGVLGDVEWEVLWPPPRGVTPGNAASVAVFIDCPATGPPCLDALLLGDLGAETQERMAGAGPLPSVDVVKVSHHGSADQSAELYSAVRATVALIGVGADNGYGHPTDALLDILAGTGTAALRTDIDGLILVAPGETRGARVWTSR